MRTTRQLASKTTPTAHTAVSTTRRQRTLRDEPAYGQEVYTADYRTIPVGDRLDKSTASTKLTGVAISDTEDVAVLRPDLSMNSLGLVGGTFDSTDGAILRLTSRADFRPHGGTRGQHSLTYGNTIIGERTPRHSVLFTDSLRPFGAGGRKEDD